MELALKIFDKLRYFIIVLGAGFLLTGMIMQYDWAYMGAIICIVLFIACDATVMIIQNAERFGLSQLHQLRGRVGRGSRKSYCILVSDNKTEKAKARLEVMRTTYDGYEIAEKDLLLRGPGDFFSSVSDNSLRQSGGFDFKFASTCEDTQVMEKAFSQAKGVINADPNLDLPEHSLLKERIKTIITNESTIS